MAVKKTKPARTAKDPLLVPEGLSESLMHWLESHSRLILAALAGVLIIVVTVWGYQSYNRSREIRAQAAYAQVLAAWPGGDATAAEDWKRFAGLSKEFIDQHKGSTAALHARLDLARALFAAGNYEEAYEVGREAARNLSDRHPLRSLVEYQMALIARQLGKNEDALRHWQSLEKIGGPGLQREIHWQVARIHQEGKDFSAAIERFERALNSPGTYPRDEMIRRELASARTTAEGKS